MAQGLHPLHAVSFVAGLSTVFELFVTVLTITVVYYEQVFVNSAQWAARHSRCTAGMWAKKTVAALVEALLAACFGVSVEPLLWVVSWMR